MSGRSEGERLYSLWQRLTPWPGGHRLFDRLLALHVPYSGSIGARVLELEPGHCRAALPDRRAVRNHLGSVHALALGNLVELTSGLALITALPARARGIVLRIEIDYLKKARGRLLAEGRATLPAIDGDIEHQVEARVLDLDGDAVAEGRVTWRLGPRPQ